MPKPTSKGIQYPVASDFVKQPGVPSKLAQDFQVMATTTDAAIGSEGARAQRAAIQTAINDANSKYGGLPGRVNHVEAHNTTQETQINNQNTRLWAVERLGGLAPGDVSDATMTSIASNPESTFHSQQVERISDSTGTVNVTDHTNLETALGLAYATGRTLVVDSDIQADTVPRSIFEVPVSGKGSITSGGNKYHVNPQHQSIQTNRIYIDPTNGNDANSGINPNMPLRTFARLNIHLSMLREKLLDGFWVVEIKAGTHMVEQGWRMDGLRTKWPLVITGAGDKETILDGTNDTLGKAFYFKHFQTSVQFHNMRIQNYIGGSGSDGYDTSAGILCQGPGQIRVEDVDIVDCTTGISVGYGISAGIYKTTVTGSEPRSVSGSVSTGITAIYGASATIGASGGLGNTLARCGTGVHVSRNSVAHVDYNTFEDNYYGLRVTHNARGAVITDIFQRNRVGISLSGGAELTYSTAEYGVGENANTDYNLRIGGSARLSSYTGAGSSAVEYRLQSITHSTAQTTPANTSRNAIVVFGSNAAIPANTLVGAGKKIRTVLYARSRSSGGERRFELSKNDGDGSNHEVMAALTVPAELGTGAFRLEFETETTDVPGSFLWNAHISGLNYSLHNSGMLHGRDVTHDWRQRIYQENLDDASDSIEIRKAEIYVTG